MRVGRRDIGAVLAFVAGLPSLALAAWPFPSPQLLRWGDFGPAWLLGVLVIASAFLAAPFLVDRHQALSKSLLVGGALVLIASGFVFGGVLQGGLLSTLMDVFPAILALLAALLIRPARGSAGERDPAPQSNHPQRPH